MNPLLEGEPYGHSHYLDPVYLSSVSGVNTPYDYWILEHCATYYAFPRTDAITCAWQLLHRVRNNAVMPRILNNAIAVASSTNFVAYMFLMRHSITEVVFIPSLALHSAAVQWTSVRQMIKWGAGARDVLTSAAESNRVDIMRRMRRSYPEVLRAAGTVEDMLSMAASNGALEALQLAQKWGARRYERAYRLTTEHRGADQAIRCRVQLTVWIAATLMKPGEVCPTCRRH